MAKKNITKKIESKIKPAPEKRTAVNKTQDKSNNLLYQIIIAILIIALAGCSGCVGCIAKKINKAKENNPLAITNTASNINTLTVTDPKTNTTVPVAIKPASAAGAAVTTTAAQGQANPPAAAAPASAKIVVEPAVQDCTYLLTQEYNSSKGLSHIDIGEAKCLWDSHKALFIDARAESEYQQRHIKGAISIPVGQEAERIIKYKSKLANKLLVTYCHGAGCHLSDKVANRLIEAGYKRVIVFFGGWPKWEDHKYPDASSPAPAPTKIPVPATVK